MNLALLILSLVSAGCLAWNAVAGAAPDSDAAAAAGVALDNALAGTSYGQVGIGGAAVALVGLVTKVFVDGRKATRKRTDQWKEMGELRKRIEQLERKAAHKIPSVN